MLKDCAEYNEAGLFDRRATRLPFRFTAPLGLLKSKLVNTVDPNVSVVALYVKMGPFGCMKKRRVPSLLRSIRACPAEAADRVVMALVAKSICRS